MNNYKYEKILEVLKIIFGIILIYITIKTWPMIVFSGIIGIILLINGVFEILAYIKSKMKNLEKND